MDLKEQQDLVWGAVAGAGLAIGYQLYTAHSAGDISGAFSLTLIPLLIIGGLAGVAAVWVRRWTGDE